MFRKRSSARSSAEHSPVRSSVPPSSLGSGGRVSKLRPSPQLCQSLFIFLFFFYFWWSSAELLGAVTPHTWVQGGRVCPCVSSQGCAGSATPGLCVGKRWDFWLPGLSTKQPLVELQQKRQNRSVGGFGVGEGFAALAWCPQHVQNCSVTRCVSPRKGSLSRSSLRKSGFSASAGTRSQTRAGSSRYLCSCTRRRPSGGRTASSSAHCGRGELLQLPRAGSLSSKGRCVHIALRARLGRALLGYIKSSVLLGINYYFHGSY